jgi:NhaC family Na+:H+ antiporter
MMLCVFWVMLNIMFVDHDMHRFKQSMISSIQKSSSVLLIYLFIGTIVGVSIISGAIPTLIFYGLKWITPSLFLPLGMLLCSVMSLAIGSCWATIGTMGVALIGIAAVLNIPLPIAAGMIVSGAYFGDKLSPLSDTTILSAHTTGTDLYKHIKGMTYSLIPAYCTTLGLFGVIGVFYMPQSGCSLEKLNEVLSYLSTHYHIGWISVIPMMVMFSLSMMKKPAELVMLVGIFLSLMVAIFVQQETIQSSMNVLYVGSVVKNTHLPLLESMLNRGGMERMLSSLSLTLLILALGGLLESYHFITVVCSTLLKKLHGPLSLVSATLVSAVVINMLVSEAYLSIMLLQKIFGDAYKKNQLDSSLLSKSIEEGATFSTPLIPWTTSGVFVATTLGVSPLEYLPWSLLNWIAPLFLIIFVMSNFCGRQMYRASVLSS